ncbi:MAG: hypothetical protein R6X20_14400 [Phycisphaerae bacterium]
MRATATTAAVVTLFALAGVGAACGVPPMVCATRALVGAVAAYALATVVQRVVLRIMVDLMTDRARSTNPSEEGTR